MSRKAWRIVIALASLNLALLALNAAPTSAREIKWCLIHVGETSCVCSTNAIWNECEDTAWCIANLEWCS